METITIPRAVPKASDQCKVLESLHDILAGKGLLTALSDTEEWRMLAPVYIKIKKLLHCMYQACAIVTCCDCEFYPPPKWVCLG